MGYTEIQDPLILDWNESPLGPPPVAVRRIIDRAHLIHRYPRGLMEEVRELAARYLGIDSSQILLTSGVDEALDITMSLAERGVGVDPGFDFNARVLVCGKPFLAIPLAADWQPPRCAEKLTKSDVVFIAQPGNPTGNLIRQEWLDEVREAAGYFFMDETYQEFCSATSVLTEPFRDARTLVYRSFAKAFGLAGIRVGCLVGHPDLIGRLADRRRFMPIDAVSLNAAAAVLEEPSFVRDISSHVLNARPELAATLRHSGLFIEVRDTETNFVVARVHPGAADAVAATLASHGVHVKSCAMFGLDDWIRVGVGTWKEQALLAERLSAIGVNELPSASIFEGVSACVPWSSPVPQAESARRRRPGFTARGTGFST